MENTEIIFEVSKLEWERVFLNLEITTNCTKKAEFRLELVDRVELKKMKNIRTVRVLRTIPFPYKSYGGGKYNFCCNIAAMEGRKFLDNGLWRIIAVVEEKEYICYTVHPVAYEFEQCSRVFRYGNGKYAYTVSFEAATEEERYLAFLINSYFMIENHTWHKRRYVQEALTPLGKIDRVYMTFAVFMIRAFYQFWEHIFPKRGNRVLLMSETRDYLWGNLKFIDDGMKAHGLDKKYRIEYSFRKAAGTHMSIFSWIKVVFKVAKQDYIFVDDYVPIFGFLTLNKRTKLIQVWHAGEGFKAVGYCRFGKDGSPFPVGSCHKQYDYVLTGSKKLVKVFAEVFGIEEEAFLPVGMPRLDGFLDEERITRFCGEFYKEYPNLENKKIVLFAPTYRGAGQKVAYYDYSWLDLRDVYEYCGEDKVFLIKMHPFVKEPIKIPEEYQDRIMDFSFYPNINDLYYVTDVLITDYSSNYFEYSLLKRPVVFFTPDRELYELSRGVHRSVRDSAPGKVCDTFEEMMEALRSEDYEVEKIYQFVEDNFANYDGHATDKAIDKIFERNEK